LVLIREYWARECWFSYIVYAFSGIISSLYAFAPTHGHHSIRFQFAPRVQMSNWDKGMVPCHHISRKWRTFWNATSYVRILQSKPHVQALVLWRFSWVFMFWCWCCQSWPSSMTLGFHVGKKCLQFIYIDFHWFPRSYFFLSTRPVVIVVLVPWWHTSMHRAKVKGIEVVLACSCCSMLVMYCTAAVYRGYFHSVQLFHVP